MRAERDNGRDIGWHDAQEFCDNYRAAGFDDWRMPKLHELELLYKKPTTLITRTSFSQWAFEKNYGGSSVAAFKFDYGVRYWTPPSRASGVRVLPVRDVKTRK